MIGYIKPDPDEFKVKELKIYNAYYCGICTSLARKYGPFSRLILSYDATFYSILEDAFSDSQRKFGKVRCPLPPFQKRMVVKGKSVDIGTEFSKFGFDLKIDDIKRDSSGIKHLLSFALVQFKTNENFFRISKPYLDKILFCEMTEEPDPMEVADQFGRFAESIARSSKNLERSSMMIYLIGRWVYLIDALDDLEKDFKSKNYNPFLLKYKSLLGGEESFKEIKDKEKASIDFLMVRIQEEFAKIENDMVMNKNLIENVLFYGMPKVMKKVFEKKDDKV